MASTRTGRQWRSRKAAVGWCALAAAFVGSGAALVHATVGETTRLTRALPATPAEIAADLVVRQVRDERGRRASFRILLFSDEFRWRLNSYDALENAGREPDFTDAMKAVLNDATEIICIGASSEEVPRGVTFHEGRAREEERAARRAEQIALWVRRSLSKPIPVRKLNVGHHAPTGRSGDTSDQRRVIIVLVLDQDRGVDMDQALRAAMADESLRAPIFETLLTRYSLSAGTGFRWVQ